MIGTHNRGRDRSRAALASLSAIGAAIAGLGVGVIFAEPLGSIAWPAAAAGIAIHLFGMVGTMRLQSAESYVPSPIERIGYWLCWAIIAALLAYAGLELAH